MDWDEYLYGFAEHAARKSKDATKVGAVLVSGRSVLCTGFNGPPAGVEDRPERFDRPAKYLFAAHAEQNLICTAASQGIKTEGCTVYVTHFPCASCARMLIQANVFTVVYGPGQTSMPNEEFKAARTMFNEAGINVQPVAAIMEGSPP